MGLIRRVELPKMSQMGGEWRMVDAEAKHA